MKKVIFLLFLLLSFILIGCNVSDKDKESNLPSVEEQDDERREIYELALKSGYTGSYEEWLDSIKGEEIVLQASGGYIQWKYKNSSNWINLISLTDLTGKNGADGKEVEFRVSDNYIQYKYAGETEISWRNLVSLSTLTGNSGQPGENGTDGRTPELRVNAGYIEWKYEDEETWKPLLELSTLIGSKGDNGNDGQTPELRVNNGYIEWRYLGEETWKQLVALSTLMGSKGDNGTDGRTPELTVNDGYIKWKYADENEWKPLLELATLTGAKGEDGTDGQTPELRVSDGYIEWRYLGEETWKQLVDLSTLMGPKGEDGTNGRTPELKVNGGYLEWKYSDEEEWKPLINLDSLKGATGNDGLTPEFKSNETHVLWKYTVESDSQWRELVAIDSLQGTDGLSAYEIYLKYHPDYSKTEEEWIEDLVSGNLGKDVLPETVPDGLELNYVTSNNTIKLIISKYYGTDENVVIPRYIDGYEVIGIKESAFSSNLTLKSIVLPDSITMLGMSVFSGCSNLESVVLPNNLTEISYYAFSYCSNLKTITIPNSVVSIGMYAFDNCSSLESVVLPENLTTIESSAFLECTSLKEIVLPNTVTSIGNSLFSGCYSLESVVLPENLTIISDSMFYNCSSLQEITIPNTVTYIGNNAFNSCYGLTEVTIPEGVTDICDEAFAWCLNLETFTFPSTIDYIGNDVLLECVNIDSIYFNMHEEDVISLGYFYLGIDATMYVLDENNEFVKWYNYQIYYKTKNDSGYISINENGYFEFDTQLINTDYIKIAKSYYNNSDDTKTYINPRNINITGYFKNQTSSTTSYALYLDSYSESQLNYCLTYSSDYTFKYYPADNESDSTLDIMWNDNVGSEGFEITKIQNCNISIEETNGVYKVTMDGYNKYPGIRLYYDGVELNPQTVSITGNAYYTSYKEVEQSDSKVGAYYQEIDYESIHGWFSIKPGIIMFIYNSNINTLEISYNDTEIDYSLTYLIQNSAGTSYKSSDNIWNAIMTAAKISSSGNSYYVVSQETGEIVYSHGASKYYCYLSDEFVCSYTSKSSAIAWGREYPNSYVLDARSSAYVYIGKTIETEYGYSKDSVYGEELFSGSYAYLFAKSGSNMSNGGYTYVQFEAELSNATLKEFTDKTSESGWNAYVFANMTMYNPWITCDMGVIGNAENGGFRTFINFNSNHGQSIFTVLSNDIVSQMTYNDDTQSWENGDDLLITCWLDKTLDGTYYFAINVKNLNPSSACVNSDNSSPLYGTKEWEFTYEIASNNVNPSSTKLLLAASYCPVMLNGSLWNPRSGNAFENIKFSHMLVAQYGDPDNKVEYGYENQYFDYILTVGADNAYATHGRNDEGQYFVISIQNYDNSDIVRHEHDFTYTVITVPATCTKDSYIKHYCECGDFYTTEGDILAHHSYEAVVTAPTCTEVGYTTYTCICGDTYVDHEVDATGHSYTPNVTNPTCTEVGYTTYTCGCGDTYIADEKPTVSHVYSVYQGLNQTDKAAVYKCSSCTATKNETKFTIYVTHNWADWNLRIYTFGPDVDGMHYELSYAGQNANREAVYSYEIDLTKIDTIILCHVEDGNYWAKQTPDIKIYNLVGTNNAYYFDYSDLEGIHVDSWHCDPSTLTK